MKLYVNGALVGQTNIALNPSINTEPMTIGGFYLNYRPFKGRLDELKIYKEALNISQIKSEYETGLDSLYAKKAISLEEYQQRRSLMGVR